MGTISLIGNPNCGKTTLFNKITGTIAHVGNWPGVTVEEKYGFGKVIKLLISWNLFSLSI